MDIQAIVQLLLIWQIALIRSRRSRHWRRSQVNWRSITRYLMTSERHVTSNDVLRGVIDVLATKTDQVPSKVKFVRGFWRNLNLYRRSVGIYKTPISKRYVLELPTSQNVGGICGKPVVLRAQMDLPNFSVKWYLTLSCMEREKKQSFAVNRGFLILEKFGNLNN